MNIYPPPDEKDSEYIRYYSMFKIAAKMLSPESDERRLHDWMQAVVSKFPYFYNTNPRVMAISSYMSDAGGEFSIDMANDAISILFQEVREGRNASNVIIDIKRYYDRLTSLE